MLNNYIKIAWRNLFKSLSFSVTNIVGLAIAMAGALLIALWLQNMLSMDRFHEKSDRLYTMSNRLEADGIRTAWRSTPKILAPSLKEAFPDIEDFTRYDSFNKFLTSYADKKLIATTSFVDPGFFNMFSLPIIKGENNIRFENPNAVVLTESYAKALFGEEEPIGKSIKIDSTNQVTVQAIMKDLPNNTDFNFDILLPYSYFKMIGYADDNWANNSINTFILLKPDANIEVFNSKIKTFSREHINSAIVKNNWNVPKYNGEIFAFPFRDQYLYNNGKGGDYTSGRIDLIKLFAWIAVFILSVACINFMNLSTARSERRAREVGVRKVIGANRSSLIVQFLTESILISLFAMLLAIIIVVIVLPYFNTLFAKNISFSLQSFHTWWCLIAFTLFTGVLAGIYPAFFLSSFKPITTIKGRFQSTNKGLSIRSILVVLQFSIAIILIVATVVVTKQIQYSKDRDHGFDENGLLYTTFAGDIEKNYQSIKNELLASNAVISVSKNLSPVTENYSNGWGWTAEDPTDSDKRLNYARYSTDADGVKSLGWTLLQGRDIDINKFPTDSASILLNEAAVKSLHLKEPIGAVVDGDEKKWTVVGVIKNFINGSPFGEDVPMVIMGPRAWFGVIHYRLNDKRSTAENLKVIEAIFNKFNPDYPFEYNFVDKAYERKFKEIQTVSTIASTFAGLIIFISCLGLLALIAYMIETRMKEIAVRKVLGASVPQVISLLSYNFIKLVLYAIMIASPIAWLVMDKWLQDYSYRIEIKWYYFAYAGLAAIVISLVTIGFQTIKAALTNPVDSLRNE
ncbi:MAG: ABC transporter permease [Sphingobacterium sp.]|jgi:ABC-type antimicrobial peptide transport system permease subunit|nr:ABC transporter permease [Sphingobacterium sp.]